MNIPTAHSSPSIERFLQHVTTEPIPELITTEYLQTNGFTSQNNRELRHVFRLLGFLDGKGKPLARWSNYKKEPEATLEAAIHECYSGLYELYPEMPYNRSDSALRVWFRPPVTGDSKTSIERAIRTFRKLCELAGMKTDNTPTAESGHQLLTPPVPTNRHVTPVLPPLEVPDLKNREAYVEFFEAYKQVFFR